MPSISTFACLLSLSFHSETEHLVKGLNYACLRHIPALASLTTCPIVYWHFSVETNYLNSFIVLTGSIRAVQQYYKLYRRAHVHDSV